MKITYLFESTTLWGGNKVALEQAELLAEAGHHVTILSRDAGPDWFPLKLPVIESSSLDAGTIPESDIIVGTYWPTVKAAYASGKGLVVHFCQGYEGDYKELAGLKPAIDEVYSYRIPKLTVSPHLDTFLSERFGVETYYIGQMLNRDIFYPRKEQRAAGKGDPFTVLIVGPFEVGFKNIAPALEGVVLAKKRVTGLRLIRASQFPLSQEEMEIVKPDVYHFHVAHHLMGEIYRSSDLFISLSKEAEGFGLPALEAMGCGVPTILSRISSYTSFDQSLDYACFVESDPQSLAEAIAEIYDNGILRESLVRRGLTVAHRFTRERVLERLERALGTILHRRE